jgi:hypothetical protein
MARYKALEPSFFNHTLVQEGEIVEINDDIENGGMTPGPNFAKVDEDDEPEASKPARKSKKAAAADEGGSDLA